MYIYTINQENPHRIIQEKMNKSSRTKMQSEFRSCDEPGSGGIFITNTNTKNNNQF
jgi:hypothetical protein